MAKGAANENALGSLHSKITAVFIKVLSTYDKRLDAIENIDTDAITDEILTALLEDGAMPNPAMLGAITKFLKDNAISFDTEALAELSDQERRLAERRKNRGNLTSLTTLKVVGE
jgi:hypothetical protein